MKGSLLRTGALRAFGRIGRRRRLCTSQPGAAAAAAWAELQDDVSIMHDVTLGATGTSPDHDRHPKVGNDVLICAGSKVLGNIEISDGAVVAASAVVNKPVAAGHTAVGIPAKHLPPRAKKVRKQEL